jgi:hypothetical protein
VIIRDGNNILRTAEKIFDTVTLGRKRENGKIEVNLRQPYLMLAT